MTLIFHNGTILTQDPSMPQVEAVAVMDGKIAAVGSYSEVETFNTATTQRIDLAGRTLIPGFNDAHVHIWKVGHLLTTMLDVRGISSIAELQSSVRDFSAKLPDGKWFMGRGYNEALMQEGRHPNRHDLDAVLPDRPAYLIRTCAHIVVANSKALELAGISANSEPPPGGIIERDEHGEPNGIFHETALGLVFNHIPEPDAAEYEAMLRAATDHQLKLGITSATDPGVMPNLMAVYKAMDARGDLRNRVNVMAIRRPDGGTDTLPLPEKHISDFLRVDSIKFFADGGLSGATAALSMNYRHADHRGVKRFERDELIELARDAHLQGLRIGTHAIGDVTIDMMLDVYEALAELGPGQRHRIEHFGLPDAKQCAKAARLGVIVAPQPVFLYSLGRNFRQYLPDELLERCYPVKSMLRAGLDVALSSDAPVVKDDNPLLGMQTAVLRCDSTGEAIAPKESITPAEALYGFTMGGAIASGDAENRGSITPGKWADLAVLSDNPLTTDPEKWMDIQVDMTLVAGKVCHER
jgi:hypothetical protein